MRTSLYVCVSCLSWVRRPRLYWCNVSVDDHASYQLNHHELYDVLEFNEPLEPLRAVCDGVWIWPAAEVNQNIRLPTFTRAIPRKNPPREPAGLGMKYPPYTYRPEFLFHDARGDDVKQVTSVTERERLMGYPTGYTLALFRKEAETEAEGRKQRQPSEIASTRWLWLAFWIFGCGISKLELIQREQRQ